MLLAEVECVFMGFILYISGFQGQTHSICALKGSSVDLPCASIHPTSNMRWYTMDTNNRLTYELYNTSEKSNFTLTINDLRESDANVYCCTNIDQQELCWHNRTELHVADLQVKVIPTSEGQTVTLMCTTSCPLTEQPAAYIWYKNSEFLYEDWSPWYQELVSSEAAVRYSCAVKGYEDLRSPEVSVDAITSTCFTVTYAKGRMCSYMQKSTDEPCTITYPRELHIETTTVRKYVTLTCVTSCPVADPHTGFTWYWNRQLYSQCESQHITVFFISSEMYSCAVKGHEELHSGEDCFQQNNCWSVNYTSRRICTLEGSSVNISSIYPRSYSQSCSKIWHKVMRRDEENTEILIEDAGRFEYHDHVNYQHTLRITNLRPNDSAKYTFRLQENNVQWIPSDLPEVTLVVTGLRVKFTPSSVVTEGQRVTLTCSTSCPLTNNTNYIWHLNGRPLTQPEKQNKHLVLDPVSSQHAGNYSCAVKTQTSINASESTLTVVALGQGLAIVNALKLVVLSLILTVMFFLCMIKRKKKTPTSLAKLEDKVQTGQSRTTAGRVATKPVTKTKSEEQQEDTV